MVYRILPAYSPGPPRVHERYVDLHGLRELIDGLDDNDYMELISLTQLREEDTAMQATNILQMALDWNVTDLFRVC